MELLGFFLGQADAAVIQQLLPIADDGAIDQFLLGHQQGSGAHGLEPRDGAVTHALDAGQCRRFGGNRAGKPTEFLDQRLGQRLHVDPRQRERQQ